MTVSFAFLRLDMSVVMLLLLVIIYVAFISLGLPDAVLGSSWPVMHRDLEASVEYAGLIALIISSGTVMSSLLSVRLIRRFGIGIVVSISVLLTALALVGFAMSQIAWMLLCLAIPLGLGAGAVDSALNNFVALHYKAKHMNYLHSFWGVGATAGPLIMANYITLSEGWRDGYWVIGLAQLALVVLLLCAIPLWRKAAQSNNQVEEDHDTLVTNRAALKIHGVSLQLLVFFCYCSIELGTGLWAASFLISEKGTLASEAAFWVAIYYGGITLGRFVCGAIAQRFRESSMIRMGAFLMVSGAILLALPVQNGLVNLGLLLIGFGCAPVFPNTLHLTPIRFGKKASQAIIGLSMATAYVGNTLVPPTLGVVLKYSSFATLPFILLALALLLLWATERLQSRHTPSRDNQGETSCQPSLSK